MCVSWINHTPTIFAHAGVIVDGGLLIQRSDAEVQLNLFCSNTMCRPEECLAKLRQHCKTTLTTTG